MHTLRIRLPLALVAGLLLSSPLLAQVPLSLEACIRLALDAPSQVTLARVEANIADRDRVVARSGFLPQAALDVGHAYNSPSRTDPSTFSFIPMNAIREFAALVTVAGEVDTSGRVRAEYQRARANQDIAGANLAIAERDLKRSVGAAYYRLLLARKLIELFQQRVDEAVAFENRTMMLSTAGEAARADVVKATAQTAAFRQALSAARLASELRNQELASFWTDDVARPLEILDVLDQPVPEPVIPDQEGAYRTRPEYRLFDAEVRGFEADARRARSALLPQLQLAVQWGVDQEVPGWSFNERGYAASASLRFNLFDWSRATSQVRQAELRRDQVEDTRDIADRGFSRDYAAALARVRGTYEQISLARIQSTAAEEDLRLSRVRYEGGEGPALEVVTAEAQLADAQSAYYAAIAEYLTAQIDLEVASGQ